MTDELSPSAAARVLGISTRTVQRWIAGGRLPARRVGSRWRVAYDALDALAEPSNATFPATARRLHSTDAPNGIAFRRVFIANRGEIARRIGRTCARLGIEAFVPATDHAAALDLLDPVAVVRAALDVGADALHPGYGFLAESPELAERVAASGIGWVGPPAAAIRAMGDKAAARRLAGQLGVPVVDGYHGDDQRDATLARAATRIGFPVLVKPAGGGGGKGMRVVAERSRLAEAIAASRREALATFADDRLVLERFLEGPRHVEVQVLFDRHGNGVHLGERDCSIQRRHQKVLEETPGPTISRAARQRIYRDALTLTGAVGYEGVGTCEFLVDGRGRHYFLEMNTRLQVEHPVTELVTGRDLVADQLAVAAGASLAGIGITQSSLDARRAAGGHAVEVRLYAEDADADFLPATGRIVTLRWPSGEGVRVDAGIDPGDEVGGRFDPMLAKIVAHGVDRPAALARLAAALDETVVLGIVTNLRFLRWLVRHPTIRDGHARIDTLERIWPPGDRAATTTVPDGIWVAAGALLGGGGWRLNARSTIRLEAEGEVRAVRLPVGDEGAPAGDVVSGRDGDTVHVDVGGRSVPFRMAAPPDVGTAARAARAAHHVAGDDAVTSPMPGAVLATHVDVGAAVEAGDPLVTLEAMKMEHVVAATVAGTVVELLIAAGDQVVRGQELLVIGAG